MAGLLRANKVDFSNKNIYQITIQLGMGSLMCKLKMFAKRRSHNKSIFSIIFCIVLMLQSCMKTFQALDRLMIPVVLRKADYLEIAPSSCYIAIDQFRSPKDLAEHLHYLATNTDEYLRYFSYRKTLKVAWREDEMIADAYCRLCRMLHENRTTNEGSDMRQSWYGGKSCVHHFAKNLAVH